MRNSALGLFAFMLWILPARADLDPELNKPYDLRVVLRIADHRLLTPIFREQVERELCDSLQGAYHAFAKVEVVTKDSRLKEVEEKGLQQALDGWHFLDNTKLHFVFIDFIDGNYEIRSRQYDGTAGCASPVARVAQTADRQLVARRAALQVDQDFGAVGTVQKVTGDNVLIGIKASLASPALTKRIVRDDIFAITQIVSQGGGAAISYPVPWTLLQVKESPENGVSRCLLLHRHDDALSPSYRPLGYRCIKLGTTAAPLRIRVITDDKLGAPLSGRQVLISEKSFGDEVLERLSTNIEGLLQTDHRYHGVAFVRIYDGTAPLAQVPLAIVDERTITIPVSGYQEAEQRGQLNLERDRWLRRVYDAMGITFTLIKDLNALVEKSPDAALERARAGLRDLRGHLASLAEERDALLKKSEGQKKDSRLNLADGEQRLEDLGGRSQDLERYIASLEETVAKEKDPKRRKWRELAEKARLLESQAEFGEALAIFGRALAEGCDDPQIKEHVESLRSSWATKDEAHAKARAFIYEQWPKLTKREELRARLSRARTAFETCREAGDALSPQMLLRTNLEHSVRLTKEVEALNPRDYEDDRKIADTLLNLADDMKNLNDDIRSYLRSAKVLK
jgi:hypothetical protein